MIGVSSSSSYIPGLKSVQELERLAVSYIQGVQGDDELSEIARSGFDDAIADINSRTWKKLLGSQDITTVVGRASWGLNRDFKDPFHVELLDSSGNPNGRLHHKEWKALLRDHPRADANDCPTYYTIDYARRELVTQFALAQEFVNEHTWMRLHYYQRFVLGGARPPEFDWYMIWKARAALASIRAREKVGFAESRAERKFRELKIDDNRTAQDWSDNYYA